MKPRQSIHSGNTKQSDWIHQTNGRAFGQAALFNHWIAKVLAYLQLLNPFQFRGRVRRHWVS
jgi:hypothetical protein